MSVKRKFISSHLEIRSAKGTKSIICCPKRNISLAVRRNRLRRILRECVKSMADEQAVFIRVTADPKENDGVLLREQWQQYLLWKCEMTK